MIRSSKSKESVTARVVPPPAGARPAGKGIPSPARRESAQKFKVWPEARHERIAAKAYDLWEERGCRHGRDLEDWLDAEAFVKKEIHEARE